MLEVERLRALAEQVRMQLIQRCIDRGVNAQGERVIVLDYNLVGYETGERYLGEPPHHR